MKELVILVNEQVEGPFPADELEARIASGELTAETPCAEPGAEDWSTLGEALPDAFPQAGGRRPVRIAKKTKEEEEEMKAATTEKLDPDVRKKILLYNLADAISVDKFTPAQAEAAIREHEEKLKKGKKLKIAAGVGGFVVSCALASLLFNCVNVGEAPGGRGQKIFEKIFFEDRDSEHDKTMKTIMSEVARLGDVRKEVAEVKFTAPRGQGSPRQTFLSFVEIVNPDVSTVTGTLNLSALAASVPENLLSSAKPEVIQLRRIDSQFEQLSREQRDLFAIMTTPLWDDAKLRESIVRDLAKDYPMEQTLKEALEVWNLVRTIRVGMYENQLQAIAKRVGEIAKSKEIEARMHERTAKKSTANSKAKGKAAAPDAKAKERVMASSNAMQWAQSKMPKFLEKLADYIGEKRIYFSAEARNEAWREFINEKLPQLQEIVESNKLQTAEIADGNAFTLSGRNMRNIIVVMNYEGPGAVYYVPAKEDEESPTSVVLADLKANRKTLTPEDVLPTEHYRVSAKQKTGGTPCFATGKLRNKEVYIVRTTPEWFYIEVEKAVPEGEPAPSRKRSVWLGVSSEFFNSVNEGEEIPMETLLTFERFGKPLESTVAGRLAPIPEDKTEAIKEAMNDAGIAFPPPPEAPYVPPAAPENPPAAADENSAESDAPAEDANAETAPASDENAAAPAENSGESVPAPAENSEEQPPENAEESAVPAAEAAPAEEPATSAEAESSED